jgi:ribosomal protein S12 methylthiotransferase
MNIHLISLGCPKNTVDSELMLGLLVRAGHRIVADPAEADLVIVNTCGFIEPAKQESLDVIMDALALKKTRPAVKVFAAGCLTQRYREELGREIPELDALLGVNEVPEIAGIVAGLPPPDVPIPPYLPTAEAPRLRITPRHYAYVKIAEGCSHRCAFCAIPAIRGPQRSRPAEDILAEIAGLAAEGAREILLIGQDSTGYGRDLPGSAGITGLLAAAAALPGDFWIRLMYAFPSEVAPELLDTLARHPRICPYLDIPFQHSHPDVLRRMGRGGSGDAYLRLLEAARRTVPDLAVRTSLITGYPGEREEHVRHLLDFVRAARFDHLGVFPYSHEEGTPAYRLRGRVAPEEAEDRRGRVMKLQRRLLKAASRDWIGRTVTVLVDGYSAEAEMLIQARTRGQAPEIDSVIYLTGGRLEGLRPGDRVEAKLRRYLDYDFAADAL